MADKPFSRKIVGQWQGQFSNISPHLVPDGGAQIQRNFQLVDPGVLEGRNGHCPITFSNQTTATSGSTGFVVSQIYFARPDNPYIVYQIANGNIKAGRAPQISS